MDGVIHGNSSLPSDFLHLTTQRPDLLAANPFFQEHHFVHFGPCSTSQVL